MDRINRAKQFMPFDALKGFREALARKEREAAEREGQETLSPKKRKAAVEEEREMLSPKKRKASAEEGKRGEL